MLLLHYFYHHYITTTNNTITTTATTISTNHDTYIQITNTTAPTILYSVHTWSGQCNKNLGNAFVIVWRIGDEHQLAEGQRGTRIRGGPSSLGE